MKPNLDRILSTSRLILEPIEGRHSDLLFDVLQDPSIYTYLPSEPPISRPALRERYEWLARRRSPDGRETWLNWAVRLAPTGQYAGTTQATVRGDDTALLAYEFGPAFRGAGYATEACRAVINELIGGYSVGVVLAYVDTRNDGSIRLLQRLGFARTGYVENADSFKGARSDEYIYSWTPSEPPNYPSEGVGHDE